MYVFTGYIGAYRPLVTLGLKFRSVFTKSAIKRFKYSEKHGSNLKNKNNKNIKSINQTINKFFRYKYLIQITEISMNFTRVIALSFHCLILGELLADSSSRDLMLMNSDRRIDDNIWEKFFIQFKKSYVEMFNPQQFTLIGSLGESLDRADEFFQIYPNVVYAIKKEDKFISCSFIECREGNFVIIFLDELQVEDILKNILKFLSNCTKCKVLFASEETYEIDEIKSLLVPTGNRDVGYVKFALLDQDVIKIYGKSIGNNCSLEIRLIDVWKPGTDLDTMNTWQLRVSDLNGCPVSVSTSSFEPKMILRNTENGGITVAGGREGELVLVVAEKLNFTMKLMSPSTVDRLKYSRKASIIKDVVSGDAEIGIGRLRPTNDIDKSLVFSVRYDEECITWGVPRLRIWSTDLVTVEFTHRVWALVGLTFVLGFTIGCIFKKFDYQKNGKGLFIFCFYFSFSFYFNHSLLNRAGSSNRIMQVKPFALFLDMVSTHLGNPVFYLPSNGGGRLMLTAFLYYATVVTTAYKTSLASILTTEKGTPAIVDAEGIIRENLSIGGSFYDFKILRDQVNDSETTFNLVERFVVNNNDSYTLNQLKFDHNFAFLARGSSLHEEKYKSVRSIGSTTFDVFESCVLSYHTVMVIQEKSYLCEPINYVIHRLSESGITEHWDVENFDVDKILNQKHTEEFFEKRGQSKFKKIFILYSCCITFCLFIFLFEIFTKKCIINRRDSRC